MLADLPLEAPLGVCSIESIVITQLQMLWMSAADWFEPWRFSGIEAIMRCANDSHMPAKCNTIAVGTSITGCPPHRSRRA
jgi:hypothetical protein